MALKLRRKAKSQWTVLTDPSDKEALAQAIAAATKPPEEAKPKKRDTSHLKQYQWKPGQSGNPLGKPPGSGSVVKWLKERLAGPALRRPDMFASLAQELANMILKHASRGNYNFVQLLLDKAESKQLTEEEVAQHVENVFNIVTKYVTDKEALANIARDLGVQAENLE